MALTQIRKEQIRDLTITNQQIATSAGIAYDKLNLSSSILGSDLAAANGSSVHKAVLDYKLIALWNIVADKTVTGTTTVVTAEIEAASNNGTQTNGYSAKGVLTTGSTMGEPGTQNYKVQIRETASKDPVSDSLNGAVYGTLHFASEAWTLSFFNSAGSPFTMAAQEVQQITTVAADSRTLAGKYFRYNTPSTSYYVWYEVDGIGSDPAVPDRTSIKVTVASPTASATDVASATTSAMNAITGIGASSVGSVVTVTCDDPGNVLGAKDGPATSETGFGFVVTIQGSTNQVDFMFSEVYSLHDAPAGAFIRGSAFADIVGVAGTHHHNELYYTKLELEGGQLDDRYFTQSSLLGGSLDGRYYTESELGATSGTSGSDLIGVSAITNLDATTVQGALAELQGDINTLSGATVSLDDAYENGSVVEVDAANVDWQLAVDKSFAVSDATDANKFVVTAGSGDSSVKIDTTGGVDIDVDASFKLDSSGGGYIHLDSVQNTVEIGSGSGRVNVYAGGQHIYLGTDIVTMNLNNTGGVNDFYLNTAGGGGMFFDSGAGFLVEAVADSGIDVTGANLSLSTVTTGNISMTSVGTLGLTSTGAMSLTSSAGLTLDDQFLTSALPLSQTGTTGLVGFTSTSIVGAINENQSELGNLITDLASTTIGEGAALVGISSITNITAATVQGALAELQSDIDGIIAGTLDITHSMDDAYDDGSTVVVDTTDVDWNLGSGRAFSVNNDTGATAYFEVTPSLVTVGLDARVKGLRGDFVTTPIPYDQSGVTALNANFTATSLVGAINENKQEQLDQVTALAKQTVSSGSTLIGVTGITGVIPTGGTVGANGTLQAVLEGIAQSAGSLKSYDDQAAFTTDKADGTYLPVDTLVLIKDTNRFVRVMVSGTNVVKDTDWEYLWDAANPMGGASFTVETTSAKFTNTGTFEVTAAGVTLDSTAAVTVTSDSGFSLTDDSGASLAVTSAGQVDIDSAAGQLVDITSDTEVQIDGGLLVDIDGTAVTIDGTTTVTAPVNTAITLNTTGTGDILLNSEDTVDVNAPHSFFRGDVTIDSGHHLNVDQIYISSVDSGDLATITGQRTGVISPNNKLVNPGFEAGTGGNADVWVEGLYTGRNQAEKYYDNWSMKYNNATGAGAPVSMLTQAVTGLNLVAHTFSLWFKGHSDSGVQVSVNGTTEALITAATTVSAWTRYSVQVTPATADGDVVVICPDTSGHVNQFYVDALMLEEGAVLNDYFSTQKSELILRIGHDAEDKISFQSMAPEDGTIEELMAINNDSVRIFGDLIVDGATTTINSTELTIDDNKITLNSNMTGDPDVNMPDSKAGIEVNRGTEDMAVLRWNETTDKWELSNGNAASFTTIMTSTTGESVLSMQTAYDGGSGVAVDDTNVDFLLSAGKSFIISSSASPNKFNVTAGSGADSIRLNTTGGIDIDAQGGIAIDENSGAYFRISTDGIVTTSSATGQSVTVSSDTLVAIAGGADITLVATDITATGATAVVGSLTQSGGAFSLAGNAASNATVAEANLTLTTTTSGNVVLDAAGQLVLGDAQVTAINFSETNHGSLSGKFFYNSQTMLNWTVRGTEFDPTTVIGALNATRDDLWEFVELLNTQGAEIGVAAGANLIGVDGITGVIPERALANPGDDGTLQEILEGLAKAAGSLKSYDDQAAFTTDKAAGTYLPVDTLVLIKDTNRFVRVMVAGTLVVEGTDWDYLWDVSNPMGGVAFVVDTTGAITLESAAASTFDVTGANLTLSTTTSGNVALSSAGSLTFNDSVQTTAVPFSQTNADGFRTEFGYTSQTDFNWTRTGLGTGAITSVMGSVNANRLDLYEYVELLRTQGSVYTAAAGAALVGADGITGITPTGGSLGGDSNVQAMLEGVANYAVAGGLKIYADEAAFTTAKAGGATLPANSLVFIQDTNRFAEVLVSGVGTTEGTHWDYLWDASNPMMGASFNVTSNAVVFDTTGSFTVATDTGFSLTDDSGASLAVTSAGRVDIDSATGQLVDITSDTEVEINGGALVDVNATAVTIDGALTVTGATNDNVTLVTSGTGEVRLQSAQEIDLTAATIDINGILDVTGTSATVDVTGAISLEADAASTFNVTGAGLTVKTTTSGNVTLDSAGEIYFDDSRTAAIPFSGASYTTLPGTTTSLLEAIQKAYDNKGFQARSSYQELTVVSGDVTNGYVVVTLADLPDTYTSNTNPSTLRTAGLFLAVYLNGLRMLDSEWTYIYSDTERRINFSTTLVDGDHVTFDLVWNQNSTV